MPVTGEIYTQLVAAVRKHAVERGREKPSGFFAGAHSDIKACGGIKLKRQGTEHTIRATPSFQGRPWHDNVIMAVDNETCFAHVWCIFCFGDDEPQALVQWYLGFNEKPAARKRGASVYEHPKSRSMSCVCLDKSRTAFEVMPISAIRKAAWLVEDLDVPGRYWAPNKERLTLHQTDTV
jgi:hypothetical protein